MALVGTFVPALVVGATTGRIAGEIVYFIKTNTKPGVYAVIGAASFLGGWTRTMMAIVVTMAEITGDISLSIPMIIAISIGRIVCARVTHHSFTHSVVNNLEDENIKRQPYQWFNSRKKKNRKSEQDMSMNSKEDEEREISIPTVSAEHKLFQSTEEIETQDNPDRKSEVNEDSPSNNRKTLMEALRDSVSASSGSVNINMDVMTRERKKSASELVNDLT